MPTPSAATVADASTSAARTEAATLASVDYVVVAYCSERRLAACLDSIRTDSATPPSVIVVDNASPDGSAEVARQHPVRPRVVVSPANLGFGGACNLAAGTSTADLLFLVNPDARLEPGATAALIAALTDPHIVTAGPRIDDPAGQFSAASAGFEPSLRSMLGHFFLLARLPGVRRLFPPLQLPPGSGSGAVDWVSGAAFLVRREAFEAVGGFDPAIFMYMEDVDLCRRLRAAGWSIRYDATARVLHEMGGSQGADQAERWYTAFDAYLVRRHGRTYARVAAAVAAVGLGLRAVVLAPVRPIHARRLGRAARVAARVAVGAGHATIPPAAS